MDPHVQCRFALDHCFDLTYSLPPCCFEVDRGFLVLDVSVDADTECIAQVLVLVGKVNRVTLRPLI